MPYNTSYLLLRHAVLWPTEHNIPHNAHLLPICTVITVILMWKKQNWLEKNVWPRLLKKKRKNKKRFSRPTDPNIFWHVTGNANFFFGGGGGGAEHNYQTCVGTLLRLCLLYRIGNYLLQRRLGTLTWWVVHHGWAVPVVARRVVTPVRIVAHPVPQIPVTPSQVTLPMQISFYAPGLKDPSGASSNQTRNC